MIMLESAICKMEAKSNQKKKLFKTDHRHSHRHSHRQGTSTTHQGVNVQCEI